MIDRFNSALDIWIKSLNGYTFIQLCTKPGPDSWSIGQLYMHLLNDTRYYMDQMRICLSNNDNVSGEPSPMGRAMFDANDFPDERLKGDGSHQAMPLPDSKAQLLKDLLAMRAEMNEIATLIAETTFSGKTRHPGFNYFSAREWLQFSEMHLRHHLRQKKRIDAFLDSKSSA